MIDLVRRFWGLFSEQKWDEARELLHPEFIAEWPQSRERMRRDGFIELNRNYPGTHRITVLRADALPGDRVVTTVWIEAVDTGQKTFACSYFQLRDGTIAHVEEYWAEPYPAPESRRRWVELY